MPYLVLTVPEEPLKLQNELDRREKEGYRVVGIVPPRSGVQAFIILEREGGSHT